MRIVQGWCRGRDLYKVHTICSDSWAELLSTQQTYIVQCRRVGQSIRYTVCYIGEEFWSIQWTCSVGEEIWLIQQAYSMQRWRIGLVNPADMQYAMWEKRFGQSSRHAVCSVGEEFRSIQQTCNVQCWRRGLVNTADMQCVMLEKRFGQYSRHTAYNS